MPWLDQGAAVFLAWGFVRVSPCLIGLVACAVYGSSMGFLIESTGFPDLTARTRVEIIVVEYAVNPCFCPGNPSFMGTSVLDGRGFLAVSRFQIHHGLRVRRCCRDGSVLPPNSVKLGTSYLTWVTLGLGNTLGSNFRLDG